MANEPNKQNPQPPPQKKGGNENAAFVRFKRGTYKWLKDQTDEDNDSVPAVIRDIVEEKKRAAMKND